MSSFLLPNNNKINTLNFYRLCHYFYQFSGDPYLYIYMGVCGCECALGGGGGGESFLLLKKQYTYPFWQNIFCNSTVEILFTLNLFL